MYHMKSEQKELLLKCVQSIKPYTMQSEIHNLDLINVIQNIPTENDALARRIESDIQLVIQTHNIPELSKLTEQEQELIKQACIVDLYSYDLSQYHASIKKVIQNKVTVLFPQK